MPIITEKASMPNLITDCFLICYSKFLILLKKTDHPLKKCIDAAGVEGIIRIQMREVGHEFCGLI